MRNTPALIRGTREVDEQAKKKKQTKTQTKTKKKKPPQESEPPHPSLRVQRSRCENSRHRFAHRGEIHPARARLAELGRSGGGGKLLSARRALLPAHRRGAGAVPAAAPLISAAAIGRSRHGRAAGVHHRRWRTATAATDPAERQRTKRTRAGRPLRRPSPAPSASWRWWWRRLPSRARRLRQPAGRRGWRSGRRVALLSRSELAGRRQPPGDGAGARAGSRAGISRRFPRRAGMAR